MTKTQIKKALATGVFNPKDNSLALHYVLKAENIDYCLLRAIENIAKAREHNKLDYLKDALSMLAIALILKENKLETKKRTRSTNPASTLPVAQE